MKNQGILLLCSLSSISADLVQLKIIQKKEKLLDGLFEIYKDELEKKNQKSQAKKATEEEAEREKPLGFQILRDPTAALGEKRTSSKPRQVCVNKPILISLTQSQHFLVQARLTQALFSLAR